MLVGSNTVAYCKDEGLAGVPTRSCVSLVEGQHANRGRTEVALLDKREGDTPKRRPIGLFETNQPVFVNSHN